MSIGGCKAKKSTASTDQRSSSESSQFDHYFIDACTHLNNGNYDMAIKLFSKCKDLRPEEASVYYELSKAYQKNNDNAMALQYAMKANQYAPSNKYYALWYSARLRHNNQLGPAIEVLENIFAKNQKDEPIVKELDYLYAVKGETAKRISLWKTYQSATNYKLSTSLKLVELYKAQKDYQSAHLVYDEIKKASPLKYQYFIDDANLYLEHNDEVNANINFEKAIEINPNNWKINYALYKSYRKKNDKVKAGNYLRQAFADVNTSFESKINACVELKNEVKLDTGTRYFTNIVAAELVKLYPQNANAILTAAKFLQESDRCQFALEGFEKAYTINPNVFDAWIGAIDCSEKLQMYKNMALVSEQALEYYPNVSSLYLSAAKAYNQLKEYKKAVDFCTTGKSYALDNDAKYLLLVQEGYAYFRLQNYAEAEKSFESAMAINSQEKELYDHIGNVKFFLGKNDDAVKNWQKAKEMGLKNQIIDKKINDRKFYE
jgi:tetratricopeptide (TPR) repeat protein